MIEDYRRASWTFLLLYVLVGLLYLFTYHSLLAYLSFSAIAIWASAHIYFKEVEGGWKNGLYLGLFYLVAGILMDGVFILITYISQPSALGAFWQVYSSPMFVIGVLEIILVCSATGLYFECKEI